MRDDIVKIREEERRMILRLKSSVSQALSILPYAYHHTCSRMFEHQVPITIRNRRFSKHGRTSEDQLEIGRSSVIVTSARSGATSVAGTREVGAGFRRSNNFLDHVDCFRRPGADTQM